MWGVQWRWRWRWRDEVFTFGTSSEVRADLEYYTYHCRSVALSDSLILGVLSHSRILTAFSQIVVFLSFSQILILSDSPFVTKLSQIVVLSHCHLPCSLCGSWPGLYCQIAFCHRVFRQNWVKYSPISWTLGDRSGAPPTTTTISKHCLNTTHEIPETALVYTPNPQLPRFLGTC
jgi:hypothetical protein